MKKHNLGVAVVALAGALTCSSALAVTATGTINHDIHFGGTIADDAPKWVWELPQNSIRFDLMEKDVVVDSSTNTKSWDIFSQRAPAKFLEGYMEPTVQGVAMQGLNADVKYLQNGIEVTPVYTTNHQSTLALKATGNKDTTAIDGQLSLTLQPVLLLAQAAKAGDTTIIAKQLADTGVSQANINARSAYLNAQSKLASQQSKVGATSITYDTNSVWPANSLVDGTEVEIPMIGGYASTISAGLLSFPKDAEISQWESVITVQVQYK